MPLFDHPSIKCHFMQWAMSLAERLHKAYKHVYPNMFKAVFCLNSGQVINFSYCDENYEICVL